MEITSTSRSSKIGLYLLLLLVGACILTIVGLAIAVGVYRNKNRSCTGRWLGCEDKLQICQGNVTTVAPTTATCPPCDCSTTSGSTSPTTSTLSSSSLTSSSPNTGTFSSSSISPSPPANCPTQGCPVASLTAMVSAGEVLGRMDLNADPCDDFYQYACGEYAKPQNRPPDKAVLQTFDLPYESTYLELHTALTKTDSPTFLGSPSTSIQKARDYYQACRTDTADDTGARQGLLQLITDVKSWPLSADFPGIGGAWNVSTWNMEDALAAAHAVQVDAFMSMGLTADAANSSNYVITVGPAQLTLNDPQLYRNTSSQQAYMDYVLAILSLLYGGGNDAKFFDVANSLWSFESSLALIYPSQAALDNAAMDSNNTKTFGDILSNKSGINIINLANKEFQASGITVDQTTKVLVKTANYFSQFNAVVANLGANATQVLSTYLVWSVINTLVPYSGESFRLAQEGLSSMVYEMMPELPVMWKSCLDETVNTLGWAAGAAYVQDYVNDNDKQNINNILQRSKDEIVNEVPTASWLQDPAKSTVQSRANEVTWQTGFPQAIDSATKLDQRYNDINVTSGNYLQNVIAARRYKRLTDVRKLANGTASSDWDRFPTAVYSYYSPAWNQVLVQAGLLHKPMYSRNFPSSFNYGGIGSILGQKIMMLYGFRENFWDNATRDGYNSKAKCFIDQYNNQSFNGIPVDGAATAIENIADTEGLRIAYNAYMKSVNNNPNLYDTILPGLNMTGAQQFFLGFTQLGCFNVDPARVSEVVTSAHVPSPVRVTMLLKNSAEFAQAFNCPANSKMNPPSSARCKL